MKLKQMTAALLSAVLLMGLCACNPKTEENTAQDALTEGSASTGEVSGSTDTGSADSGSAQVPEEKEPEKDDPYANIPEADAYMAITFDDGPTGNAGGRTERLLDGLAERNAHATFFMCGYRIKDFNSMMTRYLAEGHEVGNHTMDHIRMDTETSDGGYEQIASNNDLIASYTGEKPTVMRPVGGAYNEAVEASMKKMGMPIILWDIDTLDWKYRDAETVKNNILEQAHDGGVILCHDLYETTIEGALQAIAILKEQGYAFVTVSELAYLNDVTLEPGVVYSGFTDEALGRATEETTDTGSAAAATDTATAAKG